jgi:hypothetical protein
MGIRIQVCGLVLIIALSLAPVPAVAEEVNRPRSTDIEMHLDLTRQFYEALRQADNGNTRSLGTNDSETYLQQISVSTRFMVETNLRLLKEQAEIRALLQELVAASRKR